MYCRDNLESAERMQRYACLQTETRIHTLVIRDADRRTYVEGALLNDNADVPIPSIVLRTEHLSRSVAGRLIVDDVSFEVNQGDILAVVGPSGAGKSSLLRLLNRLDEPTSGTYFVEGREYRDFAPRELRRRVGMVMQSAYLFPGSVADNLRFGPRQRGETLSDAVVSDLVAEVGLPDFASRSIDNLSGGEAQRVSLARALANSPVVLLADEPTSALDAEAKRGIERLIVNIVRQHGLTCIIVTHDMAQASRVANCVLVMDTGKLKRIGPTQEVLSAEHT
jgi:putative ABC transport system ATP-binding protein